MVAQEAPSVSVGANAAGALEGDVLLFTVTVSELVPGNRFSGFTDSFIGFFDRGLGVRVSVGEDGNVDGDGDGTAEAGSGVLLADQEGERTVVVPPGESEVVMAVQTVGAAGANDVRVTVTVLATDGGEYAVAPGAASASTTVGDDGAAAVVFWTAGDSESILGTRRSGHPGGA